MLTKVVALILTLSTLQLLITQSNAQATSVPDCARGCVQTAATELGCQLADTICLCQASGFISNALSCASSTCQPDDQARSSRVLGEMCDSEQTTSGTPGTSTGTFSGTRSGSLPSGAPTSTLSSSASGSVITTTQTTLTVRPSLSLTTTTTVPITTSTSPFTTVSTQATSSTTRPSSSSTAPVSSLSTVVSTSTQRPNGVSTAPPGATVSQTSNADTIHVGGLLWAAAGIVVALV